MERTLSIGGRTISDDNPVFVIAEIGHNHQGDMETCERLFDAAARAGATAVKLQKRSNRSLYTQEFFDSHYSGPSSFGKTYGLHREFLEFDLAKYRHLKNYAEKLGLIFFSTAFDLESVDFLTEVGVPAIKIASGDLKSLPLLRYASKQKIPLILSTGGANFSDVELAMKNVNPANVGLLQCTAAYPAEPEDMDLLVISTFRESFRETVIGLSSHDRGIAFPVVAASLGARIIEKHFTLDRAMKGTDHAFSLEPTGMEKMIRDLGLIVRAMGDGVKKAHESEVKGIRKMGKMIVFAGPLKSGTVIAESDLRMKSPQEGLSPQAWDSIVGRKVAEDVVTDQPVSLQILD
jgi:sialic acid synthase